MAAPRRVRPDEWQQLRDTRLRALADAPTAFGTTHAEASTRPEGWWRDWAERSAASDTQAMFLAWHDGAPVGIAGAFDDGRWNVVSMWVDPAHRGSGVGRALLDAVVGFARDRGATHVTLGVTDGNDAARALYERYGFAETGAAEPLRSHPELMVRDLRLEL
jgi:ribosomal protein S18 acetylase RimI-like enzyme